MASYTTGSASRSQEQHDEAATHGEGSNKIQQALKGKITQMIEKIQEERMKFVDEKVKNNVKNLNHQLTNIKLSTSTNSSLQSEEKAISMLSLRMEHPLRKIDGISQGAGEHDLIIISDEEEEPPLTEEIKIPDIEKIPPYIFSIHLIKNEQMEKSILGKRQIYYDEDDGETMFFSEEESDEENLKEKEEVNYIFSHGEDQILRMAFDELGINTETLSVAKSFVGGTDLDIQARYDYLKENDENFKESEGHGSLKDAMKDFDKFFCRQCLIFDCRTHECSQPVITPNEKQPIWSEPEGDRKPCSDHCCLLAKDGTNEVEMKQLSNSLEGKADEMPSIFNWKPLEKDLCLKGIEIFGRNSCLIYRNLLSGLKTCTEIATYIEAEMSLPLTHMGEDGKFGAFNINNENSSRSRQRRKGKARKFKFTSKPSGHPSWRQSIGDGDEKQSKSYYTPCACAGMCNKECPCAVNKTFCEKYCGCSKICRNRFRGCQCSKSQCKSRHCPCFAATRECDPDVCRNCWVSCGDGSLGAPNQREDSQCANMKILLRQKKRILLAKSDIAGWGAFLKEPANKNDFIGEYTGELISSREADRRGKLYGHLSRSYLFNLNDKYVLDAFRKGNKLKYANHSFKPNCYAKLLLVAGNHRVGIFAQERIQAGKEIFYDYNYSATHCPPWFKELLEEEKENSKNNELVVSHGKGRKHRSN